MSADMSVAHHKELVVMQDQLENILIRTSYEKNKLSSAALLFLSFFYICFYLYLGHFEEKY